MPKPSLPDFLDLAARYSVVPVWEEVLADRDTPVSAFEKLVGDAPGFLLESVEGGERWAQWSFLGWDPAFTLTSRGGRVESEIVLPTAGLATSDLATLDSPGRQPQDLDPLSVLAHVVEANSAPDLPGLPPLHSGLVGYLGYDCVRYIERLPNRPPDDRGLPEMVWQAVGALAAFNRFEQTITLVRNVYVGSDPTAQYRHAVETLGSDAARLGKAHPYRVALNPQQIAQRPIGSTMAQPEFEEGVRSAKQSIRQGDAFQIVLSQRLEASFGGDAFAVYRALRLINPSPYLFFIRHPELSVVGSSPELMTRVRDGFAFSRPIAGTRRRGASPEEDRHLEEELLADPKERAEHVMLIDLARNDLGRVCEFGTVEVDDLMVVERYSHVMHLVSGVSGKLRPGMGPVDVLRATFPHGTVSGAPKVAAMEIIDRLEPVARGPYGGAVGYLDFSGNVDTAICLRTVIVANGKAWVQAGAGIVADSDPTTEYEETMSKAAAALQAVATADHV